MPTRRFIRSNFKGFIGADRTHLTGSAQLTTGLWQVAATTTQRWTTDPVLPLRKDEL